MVRLRQPRRAHQPAAFYGETRTDDSIIVNEGYSDDAGVFRGALADNGHFKGKWANAKNQFDFDLTETNDSALIFSVYTLTDSAKLLPDNPNSPSATAAAYTVWPTAGSGEATVAWLQKALAPALKAGEPPLSCSKPAWILSSPVIKAAPATWTPPA